MFRISMQTPVENPLMTIESFNKQFQIGEKEGKRSTGGGFQNNTRFGHDGSFIKKEREVI